MFFTYFFHKCIVSTSLQDDSAKNMILQGRHVVGGDLQLVGALLAFPGVQLAPASPGSVGQGRCGLLLEPTTQILEKDSKFNWIGLDYYWKTGKLENTEIIWKCYYLIHFLFILSFVFHSFKSLFLASYKLIFLTLTKHFLFSTFFFFPSYLFTQFILLFFC